MIAEYCYSQEQALFLPPELHLDGMAASLQTFPNLLEIQGVRL